MLTLEFKLIDFILKCGGTVKSSITKCTHHCFENGALTFKFDSMKMEILGHLFLK